jgi:LacI family transcriptional regulator
VPRPELRKRYPSVCPQIDDCEDAVAANDLLALGAHDAIRERGMRCPRDISIVGHNDMPLVDMVDPPLTTIRINPRELGREAADLLQQTMETHDATARTMVLPPKLIVRQSTFANQLRCPGKNDGRPANAPFTKAARTVQRAPFA